MNSDRNNSGANTAGPSQSVQLPKDKSLSEAMYLKEQAANAKAAIKQALGDFGKGLGHGVDPRAWTQEYPWMSLGAAAVVGFVTTSMLIPSKEEQALKRLQKIEAALHPKPASDGSHETTEVKGKKVEKKGLLASMASDLIKAVGPAVASAITAGFTAQAQADSNGHAEPSAGDPSVSPS